MEEFAMAMAALKLASVAADAYGKAREVANALKTAAQQSSALTPEQSAQLDAEAAAVFGSPEAQVSGR